MSSDPAPAPPGPRPDTSRAAVEKIAVPLVDLVDRFERWDLSLDANERYVPWSTVRALLDEREAWAAFARERGHRAGCASYKHLMNECDCGMSEMLAKLRPKESA